MKLSFLSAIFCAVLSCVLVGFYFSWLRFCKEVCRLRSRGQERPQEPQQAA